MNYFLERATELFDEMVANRRYIHENAECGMELTNTVGYVVNQLISYGYEPKIVGGGVSCTVGKGNKVLLLRGDMDALPQVESSGLPYACRTGACHSCGHDLHTTMLLAAAKMLKEREENLNNIIKFMFQPGEEVLQGAKKMIAEGILENPNVNCAFAIHCLQSETGTIKYGYGSTRGAAVFTVKVHGKSCHGARPYEGISAANVAAEIMLTSQKLISSEVKGGSEDILAFGVIKSGTASNIIPGEAILEGAIRSYSNENITYLKQRFIEIVENIAKSYRATAEVIFNPEIPALENDKALIDEFKTYFTDVTDKCVRREGNDPGTEDFAAVGAYVPAIMVNVGVGSEEQGYIYGSHNPSRVIDEEAMKVGAACYANCAFRWAQN